MCIVLNTYRESLEWYRMLTLPSSPSSPHLCLLQCLPHSLVLQKGLSLVVENVAANNSGGRRAASQSNILGEDSGWPDWVTCPSLWPAGHILHPGKENERGTGQNSSCHGGLGGMQPTCSAPPRGSSFIWSWFLEPSNLGST